MKLCSKLLAIAIIVSISALISCAGPAVANSSYQNVSISLLYNPVAAAGAYLWSVNPPGDGGIAASVVPQCTANATATGCTSGGTIYCNALDLCYTTGALVLPPIGSLSGQGTCVPLTAVVTNAPVNPTWSIIPAPAPSGGANVGTLSNAVGATTTYCSGGTPIYSLQSGQLAQAVAAGIPQGTVEVMVTNPADPNNPSNVVSAKMYFAGQAVGPPTGIVVGFNNIPGGTTVTVPLGTSYTFNGYVAGINLPNTCTTGQGPAYGVTYNVNGIAGGDGIGAGQHGIVTPANSTSMANVVYTAPTNYPSSTHSVSLTVSSTACPTAISTPVVTVAFP